MMKLLTPPIYLIIFLVTYIFLYIFFSFPHSWSKLKPTGIPAGDGWYYYFTTKSLGEDLDFNYTNEYKIKNPWHYGAGPQKIPINQFPVGTGVLQLPFYFVGKLYSDIRSFNLEQEEKTLEKFTLIGSIFYGFIGLWLCIIIAEIILKKYGLEITKFTYYFIVASLIFGTPLGWYMLWGASFSHACSFFSISLFVFLYLLWRDKLSKKKWYLLGFFLGISMMVRPQNIIFAVIPIIDFVFFNIYSNKLDFKKIVLSFVPALLAIPGVLIGFLPQIIQWYMIYGTPLTIPQGEFYMCWKSPLLIETLYSSRHGLFAWSPLIYISLFGIIIFLVRTIIKKQLPDFVLFLSLIAALFLSLYINASACDWWHSWGFGPRRFVEILPIIVSGVALIDSLYKQFKSKILSVIVAIFTKSVLIICVLFSVYLMILSLIGNISMDLPLNFNNIYGRYIGIYNRIGHLPSAPVNWLFAARHRVSPASYDLAVGPMLLLNKYKIIKESVIKSDNRLYGPLYLRDFGIKTTLEGKHLIEISGKNPRILLPLHRTGRFELKLTLYSKCYNDTSVNLSVNNVFLSNQNITKESWNTLNQTVEEKILKRGENFLDIQIEENSCIPKKLWIEQLNITDISKVPHNCY